MKNISCIIDILRIYFFHITNIWRMYSYGIFFHISCMSDILKKYQWRYVFARIQNQKNFLDSPLRGSS